MSRRHKNAIEEDDFFTLRFTLEQYFFTFSGSFSGSLILGIPLALVVSLLSIPIEDFFVPEAKHIRNKDGLTEFMLYGGFIGFFVGEVLGCWLALYWGRCSKSFLTAAILGFLLFLWLLLWVFFLVPLKSESNLLVPLFNATISIYFFVLPFCLPLLARYLTNLLAHRR